MFQTITDQLANLHGGRDEREAIPEQSPLATLGDAYKKCTALSSDRFSFAASLIGPIGAATGLRTNMEGCKRDPKGHLAALQESEW